MAQIYPNRTALTILLAVTGVCFAQQYSFRHYATAEGLENLAILSLAQDQQGYIWVGTEAGLYRYDGTRFRLMGASEGVPCTSEVQAVYVSADGAVWANTCSSLFRFDGTRFRVALGIEMLSRTQAITDGPNGHLIVSTRWGLKELVPTGASGSFGAQSYRAGSDHAGAELTGRAARGVYRQGSRLWWGCGDAVCVEEDHKVSEYGADRGLPSDSWDGIAVAPDGTVWARSPSKLFEKPPTSEIFISAPIEIGPSMYWGAITVEPDATVLAPTDNGLVMFKDGRWSVADESSGLRSSITTAVLRDRSGSLWIGLAGAGLARWIGPAQWESWTKAQGLPSNLIWNILRDRKGSVWIATNAGLARIDSGKVTRIWAKKDGLAGDNVRWLGETSDGAIWEVSEPGGLARVDPATGNATPVGSRDGLDAVAAHRGLVDHAGRLWVVSRSGLYRNDAPAKTRRFTKVNPPGALPIGAWAAAEDAHGTIWIASPDGLWRLREDQWRHYTSANGLLNNYAYVIAVAADDSLWIRRRFDSGIERVEFDGDRIARSALVTPPNSSGLDVTAFHGFDAKGNFWRGMQDGVHALHNGLWTQFATEDGLIWNDCDGEAFWADSDGSVWFGTSGGVSHFRPSPEDLAPPVADPILTSLDVSVRPRLVRASFSTLSYRYEQSVRFEYRLDDERWSEAPEHSVSIAGIDPGQHRLEIRSRVRNGPFSTKLAAREFYVQPLWWETWWLRSIALLLAAGIVYGAVLWRHHALRQRNAALQRAVHERTAELEAERAKVLEEKRKADAANLAKGQFLASMSHEIRTPLNGLLGLTALLEQTHDDLESQAMLRLIRSSGQALQAIINDVLDFSKVEAGKLELEIAPFQLPVALEAAVALFRATAAEKNVHLGVELAAGLPDWVLGDQNRLRQVVLNLVSNALKFTEQGEVVIWAALASENEASQEVRIEIRDTGIGISPERLANLFASYSQADSSISRRYGGTGLGLAISKRLVELMGGRIDVESTPGVGSAFGFTVPLKRAVAPPLKRAVTREVPDLRSLKVLLAEDNKVNQFVALKLLEKFGIAADLAENGTQAIEEALKKNYDVILMDVQMPGVDGIAATREIRRRLKPDCQPFICGLTAHATIDIQDLCLSSGMDDYLTKPLDIEKLRNMLSARCSTLQYQI